MELKLQSGVVDAGAAWRLLADTDHLHRVGGLPPVETRLGPDEHGFSVVSGVFLGPAGIRHRFVESSQRWVHRQSFKRTRRIEGPLLKEMVYEARLVPEPSGEGVVAHLDFRLEPVSQLTAAAMALTFRGLRAQWQRELDALPPPGGSSEPRALRVLSPLAQALLERWRQRVKVDPLVRLVRQRLVSAPDWALQELPPLQLGFEAGVPADVALETCRRP